MNFFVYVGMLACFCGGWYACNKKDQVKTWIKGVLKKAHKKTDSL